MFAKVNKPDKAAGNNAGSCGNLMEYLDKESRESGDGSTFFNLEKEDMELKEAIAEIDRTNSKMGKDEAKYYHLSLSPSEREQAHMLKRITGRRISDISELSPGQKAIFEKELKDFTNKAMDIYAMNFDKGLRCDDLVYVANIEHLRSWGHRDKQVIKNKSMEKEVRQAQRELAAMQNPEGELSRLERETEELREELWSAADGSVPTNQTHAGMLKGQMQLLQEKQQIASMINELGMFPEDIKVPEYEKAMSDDERALFEAYYGINKELMWVQNKEDSAIMSRKHLNHNSMIATKIKSNEYLMDHYRYGTVEKQTYLKEKISRLEKALDRDANGRTIREGLKKEGLQSHVHVVVAKRTKKLKNEKGERTAPPVKISPNTKSKGHKQKIAGKQTEAQIGFDHERFKEAVNELFKERFNYRSTAKEQYSSVYRMAKGTVKGQVKKHAIRTMGHQAGKTLRYGQDAVRMAKAAMTGPKGLAVQMGKTMASKAKQLMKAEFKQILSGKVLSQ